ncbi:hypothetical protein [Sneathiella sp.]|uniref:hypothetical protein n=1 Tax=Sneathiella sp. TaxID=1964365 RepID=UPI0026199CAD|nr:hypothetical protein [Sneathiella sp.]MDF2366320.1 hypothetical protein [Sneathiella sp.]
MTRKINCYRDLIETPFHEAVELMRDMPEDGRKLFENICEGGLSHNTKALNASPEELKEIYFQGWTALFVSNPFRAAEEPHPNEVTAEQIREYFNAQINSGLIVREILSRSQKERTNE